MSLQILDFKTDVDRLNVGTLLGSGQPFNCSENLKMSILVQSFTLLSQACENSRYATSIIELFEPALALLRKVPVDDLHKNVKVILDNAARRFTVSLEFAMEKRIPLRMQKRKAIAIKSHIPKFESGYSADKKYEPNRERATAQKDKAEYRKEFKGAIRELRRDAQFVNGQRLAERKDKDAAYKKKIDKIVGQLSTQEGTIRGFEREAKKSKKKHSK